MSKFILPLTIASLMGLLNVTASLGDSKTESGNAQRLEKHCPKRLQSCCDTRKEHACKGDKKQVNVPADCCKSPCCKVGSNCCG